MASRRCRARRSHRRRDGQGRGQLAKGLALACFVINCGDGLDAKFMGGFFNGLASSGAWACLDEFNRIDVEVLSVVAVQLLTLQQALRRRSRTVYIDGPKEVPLVSSAAVFATMNPTCRRLPPLGQTR